MLKTKIIEKYYPPKKTLELFQGKKYLKSNYICEIKYSKIKNINTNFLNPNIMSPFSFIPFMECYHAIFCMNYIINGSINKNIILKLLLYKKTKFTYN